jgi:hypothetical protein
MRPALISAVVLAASLSVAAGSNSPLGSAKPATSSDCAASSASIGSASLSSADRAELRTVELRDADLSQVKAGFDLDDHDTMLVLGTIAVVVLIALLL